MIITPRFKLKLMSITPIIWNHTRTLIMTIEATVQEATAGINRLRKAGGKSPVRLQTDKQLSAMQLRMECARKIENMQIEKTIDDE
jgi:hypothetical protein